MRASRHKMHSATHRVRSVCPQLCSADLQVCGRIHSSQLWIDNAFVRKTLAVGKQARLPQCVSFAGIDYVWPKTAPKERQVLTASNTAGHLAWSDANNSEAAAGPTNSVQLNKSGKLFGTEDFAFDGSQCRIKGEVNCDASVAQSLSVTSTANLPDSTSLASVPYLWPKELPKTKEVLTAKDGQGGLQWREISALNPASGPEGSIQRNQAGGLYGSADFTYDTSEGSCNITGKVSADSLKISTANVEIANVVYEWPGVEPSTGDVLTSSETGKLKWAAPPPPAEPAQPGGPVNAVQINSAGGEFGGSSALLISDGVLDVNGNVTCSGSLSVKTVDATATVNAANVFISDTLTTNRIESGTITVAGLIEGNGVTVAQKLACGDSTMTTDEICSVNIKAVEAVEAKTVSVSGSIQCADAIEAGGLLSSGSMTCKGNMTCAGDATVDGNILAANLNSNGAIQGAALQVDGPKTTFNKIEYTWPNAAATGTKDTLMSSADGSLQWAQVKPPGGTQQVIYNDNGDFGADPAFQFDALQQGATLGGSPVTIGEAYYKLLTDSVSKYQRVTDAKFVLRYTYTIDNIYTSVATIPQLVFPPQESYPPAYSVQFLQLATGPQLQLNWYVYFPDGQPSNMPLCLQFFAFLTIPTK